ncbi:hypothetical protein VST7929_00796 [Vibrio stylophorae]|uniref:Nucleoside-specific channel-forming protein, Tsx n=1 Tax=Vibrio stylophorae TaxID=659351 RepID=A0ABM8ZRL5_9VIBR|nr:outer membrane protein OmpK [Vibrio stylophorae]CAH0532947.1 hypothetical protein VST7929_00796 [Vibrio stylophorae]
MRKSLIALGVLAASAAVPAQADYLYGFANTYVDYLNWKQGTEEINRDSHITLGIEGGAGFDWGEIYGFYEYEKLNMGSDSRSQAAKVTAHYKLIDDFTLYGQIYDLNDNKFGDEQNRVIGFGYTGLVGEGWWFKPFIGYHDMSWNGNNSQSNGDNGGMLGWVGGYSFNLGEHNFLVTNWNEIEFARNAGYANAQGGKTGLNGGLSISYDITDRVYTSFTYRYFDNKLGVDGYGDALIYRIGIHL